MSKAAELAALIGSGQAQGNRNIIINGATQLWQRGTSVDTIASGGYLCDRWRVAYAGTDGNVDVDQDTSVPTGQGFGYSQKVSMDASESSLDAGDQVNVTQRIEAQNLQHLEFGTSSAKSLVVSFWVKSSVAATYSVEWVTPDGTERMIGRTYTINSANTWEYKTLNVPGDPSATINNDNGIGLDLRFWLDAGSSWTSGTFATDWENTTQANRVSATTGWLISSNPTWHITGIQLEIGDVSTPFEHEDFGTTLEKCRRYCQVNPVHLGYNTGSQAVVSGSGTVQFTPIMRATPTVTGTFSPQSGNAGTFALATTTSNNVHCYNSANNWSASQGIFVNDFKADAEL